MIEWNNGTNAMGGASGTLFMPVKKQHTHLYYLLCDGPDDDTYMSVVSISGVVTDIVTTHYSGNKKKVVCRGRIFSQLTSNEAFNIAVRGIKKRSVLVVYQSGLHYKDEIHTENWLKQSLSITRRVGMHECNNRRAIRDIIINELTRLGREPKEKRLIKLTNQLMIAIVADHNIAKLNRELNGMEDNLKRITTD